MTKQEFESFYKTKTAWDEKKLTKRSNLGSKMKAIESRECSFQPKVNQSSKIFDSGKESKSGFFHRLQYFDNLKLHKMD